MSRIIERVLRERGGLTLAVGPCVGHLVINRLRAIQPPPKSQAGLKFVGELRLNANCQVISTLRLTIAV